MRAQNINYSYLLPPLRKAIYQQFFTSFFLVFGYFSLLSVFVSAWETLFVVAPFVVVHIGEAR